MTKPIVWTQGMKEARIASEYELGIIPFWWDLSTNSLVHALRARYTLHFKGGEKLPKDGGAVVMPTHHASADIPLVAYLERESTDRRAHFLMKQELLEWPVIDALKDSLLYQYIRESTISPIGKVMLYDGGVPIKRGEGAENIAPIKFLKAAVKENLVNVFPAASRYRDLHGPVKRAVILMWSRSGQPIYPVGIKYSHLNKAGSEITLNVGDPLTPNRDNRSRFTELIHIAQARLAGYYPESNTYLDTEEYDGLLVSKDVRNHLESLPEDSTDADLEDLVHHFKYIGNNKTMQRLIDPLTKDQAYEELLFSASATVLAHRALEENRKKARLYQKAYDACAERLDKILGNGD